MIMKQRRTICMMFSVCTTSEYTLKQLYIYLFVLLLSKIIIIMVIIIALLTHYLETTRTRKCKNLVLLSQFADIAHFCIKRNILKCPKNIHGQRSSSSSVHWSFRG